MVLGAIDGVVREKMKKRKFHSEYTMIAVQIV